LWHEQFEKEGHVIAITISERLSGSYNSACVAKSMVLEKESDKKIGVINSCSTGPEMVLIIRKLCKLIAEGYNFDDVMDKINEYMNHSHIVYALCSFNNLVKNGRMSRIAGFVANKLGFWGVGIATPEGAIDIKHKVRGKKKVIEAVIKDMRERGARIESVVISNCQNMEIAEKMKQAIKKEWNKIDVKIVPVRGLCAYYTERGGFLVGYDES
jgi:DegV family protein with EDD domain